MHNGSVVLSIEFGPGGWETTVQFRMDAVRVAATVGEQQMTQLSWIDVTRSLAMKLFSRTYVQLQAIVKLGSLPTAL